MKRKNSDICVAYRAVVITGITNATSESLNRVAKLEARLAYEFCNR